MMKMNTNITKKLTIYQKKQDYNTKKHLYDINKRYTIMEFFHQLACVIYLMYNNSCHLYILSLHSHLKHLLRNVSSYFHKNRAECSPLHLCCALSTFLASNVRSATSFMALKVMVMPSFTRRFYIVRETEILELHQIFWKEEEHNTHSASTAAGQFYSIHKTEFK